MTIEQVKKAIEARGFEVSELKQNGDRTELVVKKDGSEVKWPAVVTGKSGQVVGVELKSYHPPKTDGMNEHSTVAIFGDVYAANVGRPSVADKLVAAALMPKAEPEPEKKEEPKEEPPKVEEKKEVVPAEVVETSKKGRRQHAAA
jgi:hypothetical protein